MAEDIKSLEAQALKKYVCTKVFVRKEQLTVMAKSPQEAGEAVIKGFGRHAGQVPEQLVGMEVTEARLDTPITDEEEAEAQANPIIVPQVVKPKDI